MMRIKNRMVDLSILFKNVGRINFQQDLFPKILLGLTITVQTIIFSSSLNWFTLMTLMVNGLEGKL